MRHFLSKRILGITPLELFVSLFILGLLVLIIRPSFHGEVVGTVNGSRQRPASFPAPFECLVQLKPGVEVVAGGLEGFDCTVGRRVILREMEVQDRKTYAFVRYLDR